MKILPAILLLHLSCQIVMEICLTVLLVYSPDSLERTEIMRL